MRETKKESPVFVETFQKVDSNENQNNNLLIALHYSYPDDKAEYIQRSLDSAADKPMCEWQLFWLVISKPKSNKKILFFN